MNKVIGIIAVGAAAAAVSACASDYYGHRGPAYAPAYVAPAPIAYDSYYDGAYGDYYDGYWDNDGAFYYTDAANHPFVRDDAHHFRRDNAPGFHGVNGLGVHHGLAAPVRGPVRPT